MRKSSLTILFVVSVIGVSLAKMPLMPNIKDQFKKKDLKDSSQLELQADELGFSQASNKAHAKGNVVVNSKDKQLYSDELLLNRVIQEAVAWGHVYLDTPDENVIAEHLTYNFNAHTGEFVRARVYIDPYQIKAQRINKLSENHMSMDEGYLTTCDLDEPHYRMGARRMDVYTHDKAVIRGMKVYLGKVPVMYLPYYVQDLKNRPLITFEPGEKKDFGLFLLTTARFQMGQRVKVALHLDTRERNGVGEGFDVKYNTPNFGSGLLSAYYTDENHIAGSHLWDMYNSSGNLKGPTTHHERYRIMWRHHWQVDKNTDALFQFYKIHDYDILNNGFLKNYFPREYQQNAQNSNLDTYFLLTHVMPHGTLTFNVDTSRINRPLRGIERIPELKYILNNQQIGRTGFYAKSSNTFSDLTYQNYPKTFNEKTLRFDSNNDISHPFKIGFISLNPHLGGEETYYSRTADINQSNIIRGLFRGSVDMSTKFYKTWQEYHSNFAGVKIDGLRHVITPTITYLYQAKPTFPASRLNQFDTAIDNLYRVHQFEFGLENKWQTKREGQIVDLLRLLISVNYGLKETTGHRGFDPYDATLDFNPTDWLTLHNVNEYDFHAGHWNSENLDAGIHGEGWSFALGNRYTRTQSDQITSEINYRLNPKWKIKIYNTLPVTKATDGNITSARENEFVVTRDLHEWEMDLTVDQKEGQGTSFYVLFRLKAFPDMKMNVFGSSFQAAKPGA